MTCPDPETLAALIDGTLSGDERAATVAHLADCEACREVFAGAVETIEMATEPTAVTALRPRRGRRALRAAIVVLAAVAATLFASRMLVDPDPELAADVLAGVVPAPDAIPVHSWSATRGAGAVPDPQVSAFRIGVLLTDLEAALAAGADPSSPAAALQFELRAVPGAEPILADYINLFASAQPAPAATLLDTSRALEARLRERLGSDYLELGVWLEATRLAVSTSAPGRTRLRQLSERIAELRDLDLTPEQSGKIEAITSPRAGVESAGNLAARLGSLIASIGT